MLDLIGTNPLLGCENVVCLLGPMLAEETMLISYPLIMLLPHEEPMFGTDFWRDSALVRHLCNGDPSLLPRCAQILALAVQSVCTNDLLMQRCHGMVTAEAFLHMVCERYVVHLSDMGIVPLADSPLSLYDGLEPFETIDPKAKPQAQGTFIGPRHVRKSSYGGVVFVFPQTASSTSRAKEYWKLPYWLRAKSEYERCDSTLPFRSLLWRRDDGSKKSHPKTLLDMVRLVRHEMLSDYEGREGKPMTVGRYAAICSICEECDPWTGRHVAAPREILMNETQMSGFLARPFLRLSISSKRVFREVGLPRRRPSVLSFGTRPSSRWRCIRSQNFGISCLRPMLGSCSDGSRNFEIACRGLTNRESVHVFRLRDGPSESRSRTFVAPNRNRTVSSFPRKPSLGTC